MPTSKKNGKKKNDESKDKQAKSEPRRCNCSTTCGKLIAKRTRNTHYRKILDKSTIRDSESEDDSQTPSDVEMQAADGVREQADEEPMYTPSPEPAAPQDADDNENSCSDADSVVGSDFELEEDSDTEFGLEKDDEWLAYDEEDQKSEFFSSGQILREMVEMVLGSDDEDAMMGLDEEAELSDSRNDILTEKDLDTIRFFQNPKKVEQLLYRHNYTPLPDSICDVFDGENYKSLCRKKVVVDGQELSHRYFSHNNDIALSICTHSYLLFERRRKGPSATPILAEIHNVPPNTRTHLGDLMICIAISFPLTMSSLLANGIPTYDSLDRETFDLHAYNIAGHGDILAVEKMMNIKGHNSLSPCRNCRIKGFRNVTGGETIYYVPLSAPCEPHQQPATWDPRNLPLRTHKHFLEIIDKIANSTSATAAEKQAKFHGVKASAVHSLFDTLVQLIDKPHPWDEYNDTSDLISVEKFMHFVLVPQVAATLIFQDMECSELEAVDILDDSRRCGEVLNPGDIEKMDVLVSNEVSAAPPRHDRKKLKQVNLVLPKQKIITLDDFTPPKDTKPKAKPKAPVKTTKPTPEMDATLSKSRRLPVVPCSDLDVCIQMGPRCTSVILGTGLTVSHFLTVVSRRFQGNDKIDAALRTTITLLEECDSSPSVMSPALALIRRSTFSLTVLLEQSTRAIASNPSPVCRPPVFRHLELESLHGSLCGGLPPRRRLETSSVVYLPASM
ncbi:hypothetical protein DFH06DRAFT_1481700 [Mycena polygramma]|nr:hypothetical protein DFH06DRAFT_1481700 [Mycena polygramma]